MSECLQAFPWYGGKFSHLEFILPRLPQTKQYVEPFGGSAAVLLSREPSSVETYNDIDGDGLTALREAGRSVEYIEAYQKPPSDDVYCQIQVPVLGQVPGVSG